MVKKKLWERITKMIRRSDVVLELADARFCRFNNKIERLCKKLGKKHIRILTKVDLIGKREAEKRALKYGAIPFSKNFRSYKNLILNYLKNLRKENKKDLWVCVVGHQNAGKSTLINVLSGRKKARTSPRAGFTRGEQWIRLMPGIMLIDTPGTVPVRGNEEDLVVEGILNPEDASDPVKAFIRLIERFPDLITIEPLKYLEEFARKRGLYLKGGVLNIEEAAVMVLRKWQREGKLPKL